jgi:ABC-type polysaccharide/polyol phosphate export permease
VILQSIRELIARRDLVYILTWREVKIRYKQSVMGLLWAVLMPLVIVCSGLVVRYTFSRVSGTPLSLADVTAVGVKAVPWAFVVGAVRFGTNSLITNSNLVTKVYMPRLAFPISAVCAQLLDFAIAGRGDRAAPLRRADRALRPALLGARADRLPDPDDRRLRGDPVRGEPVPARRQISRRRVPDLRDLLHARVLRIVAARPWGSVVLINPISPLLEALSTTIVHHQSPSLPWLGYSFAFTALLCAGSLAMFAKLEPMFAESV